MGSGERTEDDENENVLVSQKKKKWGFDERNRNPKHCSDVTMLCSELSPSIAIAASL